MILAAALQAEMLDVGASSLRYPQPVQHEQGNQRMLGRRAEPGGNEQGTELVAVHRGGTAVTGTWACEGP